MLVPISPEADFAPHFLLPEMDYDGAVAALASHPDVAVAVSTPSRMPGLGISISPSHATQP